MGHVQDFSFIVFLASVGVFLFCFFFFFKVGIWMTLGPTWATLTSVWIRFYILVRIVGVKKTYTSFGRGCVTALVLFSSYIYSYSNEELGWNSEFILVVVCEFFTWHLTALGVGVLFLSSISVSGGWGAPWFDGGNPASFPWSALSMSNGGGWRRRNCHLSSFFGNCPDILHIGDRWTLFCNFPDILQICMVLWKYFQIWWYFENTTTLSGK